MNDLEWNAENWAERFRMLSEAVHNFNDNEARVALRELRIAAYHNTVAIAHNGGYVVNGKSVRFDEDDVRNMVEGTRMYWNCFDVRKIETRVGETRVVVENKDCLLAARELQLEGYDVAVLNMASRQQPGGGVITGSGAQEENLFRRSNLYQSMYQYIGYGGKYGVRVVKDQYPLDRNFGGVYTPNAIVFRGLEREGYPLLEEPYKMSFIAVAGMNRPALTADGWIDDALVEGIRNKIRTILRIGLEHGHDALVLGALGCGAFHNPPKHMAKLFHEVIDEPEFKNKYKLLYFAILEDHNSNKKHNREGNYKPFAEEFCDEE